MRGVCFTLALLTCCGSCKPSPLSKLMLVQPGENVTLPCSERLNRKMVWFRQLSDEMIALTTTVIESINNRTRTECHCEDNGHFTTQEDSLTKSISLKITGVTESDQGLYYCVEWERDKILFGKGVRLIFPERPSPSCWTLLVVLPLVVAVLTALCVCGLCSRRVCSPPTCSNCARNNDSMKTVNLHYASLHLPNKRRPSRQRETPPLSGDIIYASVALQPPTNQPVA